MAAAGVALLEAEELELGLDAVNETHGGRLCVWECVCGFGWVCLLVLLGGWLRSESWQAVDGRKVLGLC